MRPFLIVGCGGSGGVTLQFMMDQVLADLADHGITKIPAAWQFLHVDVPQAPDGIRAGLPATVPTLSRTSGGYVGIAQPAATFGGVTAAVTANLTAQKQLGLLAAWQTDPSKVNVPITTGAGQMRSVGRVATLSGLPRVRQGIRSALSRMVSSGARAELDAVNKAFSPGTGSLANQAPVTIVVSSMAGGAGASMVLDICRLLSQEQLVDPGLTGLFLYTPEIFDDLPANRRMGIPGNALAMMGELMATSVGAASRDDIELMAALGEVMSPASGESTFRRIFPIGAKIADTQMKFADGDLDGIYRGVGRGLAALVLSQQVTTEWVAFDLTNPTPRTDPLEDFGWSANADAVQWGSFGFAQLNLGRDRYGEYAAQRIARECVDRLLRGHGSANAPGTDLEQLQKRVQERYEAFVREMGLPGTEGTQGWFRQVVGSLPNDTSERSLLRILDPILELRQTVDATQWIPYVGNYMRDNVRQLQEEARESAYAFVYSWQQAFLVRAATAVEDIAGLDGLPTAIGVLERLGRDVESWAQQMRDGAKATPRDPAALPVEITSQMTALRGQIGAGHGIVSTLRQGYGRAMQGTVAGETATKLGELFTTMAVDLIEPLSRACSHAFATLQAASNAAPQNGGLAQLRTDEYAEWPAGGDAMVPERFTQAHNEVLLIDAKTFASQFSAHLVATEATNENPSPSASQGMASAVRAVILHRWDTPAGSTPGGVMESVVPWRPAALDHEPGSIDRSSSSRAQYRLAVEPKEVLARSRAWARRQSTPIDRYVKTSLRNYIAGDEHELLSGTVAAQRRDELLAAFRNTLELARPLVSISQSVSTTIHGSPAGVVYKFSEVPFGGHPLAQELAQQLQDIQPDPYSLTVFNNALAGISTATRLDVFGSYAPMTPLAFTSLLSPLATGWAQQRLPLARQTFWDYRRSRRVPGAVAMNETQRKALVAGWYVARYTGRLRLPGESHAQEAVEIWDGDRKQWVAFPHPMLVPPTSLDTGSTSGVNKNNYLPAVLLSYSLAMTAVSAGVGMEAMKPFTLLRKYWDDTPGGRPTHHALTNFTAAEVLADWAAGGSVPSGTTTAALAQQQDPEANRRALIERFTGIRDAVGEDYLRPGLLGAQGGGGYSVITRTEDVFKVPLFHEVADDVYLQLGRLVELLTVLPIHAKDATPERDNRELI